MDGHYLGIRSNPDVEAYCNGNSFSVIPVWAMPDRARAALLKAFEAEYEGLGIDAVVEECSSGRAQLWFLDKGEGGVLVTRIIGKTLHVWLAGGAIALNLQMIVRRLKAFAQFVGLNQITAGLTNKRLCDAIINRVGATEIGTIVRLEA